MAPTMAEREAELAALQSAFDEYIASSRELEEELDAELAKMRKWLVGHASCRPGSRHGSRPVVYPYSIIRIRGRILQLDNHIFRDHDE